MTPNGGNAGGSLEAPRGDTLLHYFSLLNGAGSDRYGLFVQFLSGDYPLVSHSFPADQCKQLLAKFSATRQIPMQACFYSHEVKCGTSFRSIEIYYRGQ